MKRKSIIPIFFLFFLLSLLVFFFANFLFLKFGLSFADSVLLPLQSIAAKSEQKEQDTDEGKLRKENETLRKQLRNQTDIENENKALKDQFQTATIPSQNLLSATIIGFPSFIPGETLPEYYIIDKGKNDGVQKDQAVIVNNNLLGFIQETEPNRSRVQLVTQKNTSFTAKAQKTGALGVIRGKGNGEMTFENVLLSEKLDQSDSIVTKGDTTIHGVGIPPELVVGKIISIDKKPSALFQSGKIQSFIDFTKVSLVFVVLSS